MGTGRLRFTSPPARDYISTCAISPDSAFIVYGDEAGSIRVLDARRSEEISDLRRQAGWIRDCAISPDSSWFVCASGEFFTCWKAPHGDSGPLFKGHESEVMSCAISPDGTWFVSAANMGAPSSGIPRLVLLCALLIPTESCITVQSVPMGHFW